MFCALEKKANEKNKESVRVCFIGKIVQLISICLTTDPHATKVGTAPYDLPDHLSFSGKELQA